MSRSHAILCSVLPALLAASSGLAQDGRPRSAIAAPPAFLRPDELVALARAGRPLTISSPAGTWTLILEPDDLFTRRADVERTARGQAILAAPAAELYRGRVRGDPSSAVRVAFTSIGMRGVIASRSGTVFIEPVLDSRATASPLGRSVAHHVYAQSDLDPACGGTCLEDLAGGGAGSSDGGSGGGAGGPGMPVLEVAVEADHELFQRYGAASIEHLESVFHIVSGIYEAELGLSLGIVSLRVWTSERDPYASTEPRELLEELRIHWGSTARSDPPGTVHLVTGKDLAGDSVGYAGVGVACNTYRAVGLSQDLGSLGLTALIVAHEIAHNLGARHDPSTSLYIMSPFLSSSTLHEFSGTSKVDVARFVAGAACIEAPAGPAPDPSGFVRGDANGDAAVDLSDPLVVLVRLFGNEATPDCPDALDADDSGWIDIGDAARLLYFMLSGGSPPPAPYPEPSSDPTADGLGACSR